TQAEAVLELIHAKSTKSMETAVRQLAGALSAEFRKIKDALMKIYAHLEAYLDFPDEQLEIFRDAQFLDRFRGVRSQIERLAASFRRGSILKEGVVVAIVGKPNTGKSSLFNALLERDRAIVSEYPGTTRDTLEEAIEIDGIYVRLTDTAGLDQDLEHPLDRISMQRTREALGAASICLWLLDGSGPFEEADRAVLAAAGPDKRIITLINKVDLPERLDPGTLAPWAGAGGVLKISVKTREGLDQLERRIAETISQETFSQEEGEQVTRLRHLHALERALAALQRAEASFAKEESLEYVIVDLRESLDCLRELIGEIYSEDLLDVIFSEFCIGK
ncbi:MAG: GTPase, partial [Candidatus Omnitrophota bacterium]